MFTYGYKTQTERAADIIENGSDTDSYARSSVVPSGEQYYT